jgi:hypothetical protein
VIRPSGNVIAMSPSSSTSSREPSSSTHVRGGGGPSMPFRLRGRFGPTPSIIVAWSGSGPPVSRDSRR